MEAGDMDEVHRFGSLEVSALRAYGSLALPADLEVRMRELEAAQDAKILTLNASDYEERSSNDC
jgi:hypothetical protein